MLNKKGFTLIELLVVIIIVGILAAVAVPMMQGNLERARGTEGVAALGAVRTAERIYYSEHDTYTGDETLLSICGATDLGGKYYNGESMNVTSADGSSFTINIAGNGTYSSEWAYMHANGDIEGSWDY